METPRKKRLTPKERERIYKMFDGRCAYCGKKIESKDMQVDHFIPLRVGGEDALCNMVPACRMCNHYKSSLTPLKFKQQLRRLPIRLLQRSYIFRLALRFGLVEICNWDKAQMCEQDIAFWYENGRYAYGFGAIAEKWERERRQ